MTMRFATLSALILTAAAAAAQTVVAYPWTFDDGTETARKTAMTTLREILSKGGYTVVNQDGAMAAFKNLKPPMATREGIPIAADLSRYAKATGARFVLFGRITWHTRSIWVGSGPKTISTATVDTYIFDNSAGRVVYEKTDVQGRSDEKENTLKDVGAVLVTPMITVVSGGPKTPQEQRAVQIALARANLAFIESRK